MPWCVHLYIFLVLYIYTNAHIFLLWSWKCLFVIGCARSIFPGRSPACSRVTGLHPHHLFHLLVLDRVPRAQPHLPGEQSFCLCTWASFSPPPMLGCACEGTSLWASTHPRGPQGWPTAEGEGFWILPTEGSRVFPMRWK